MQIIYFIQNREFAYAEQKHVNKLFLTQNKEYLPNTHIHVFEVFRTETWKINVF